MCTYLYNICIHVCAYPCYVRHVLLAPSRPHTLVMCSWDARKENCRPSSTPPIYTIDPEIMRKSRTRRMNAFVMSLMYFPTTQKSLVQGLEYSNDFSYVAYNRHVSDEVNKWWFSFSLQEPKVHDVVAYCKRLRQKQNVGWRQANGISTQFYKYVYEGLNPNFLLVALQFICV